MTPFARRDFLKTALAAATWSTSATAQTPLPKPRKIDIHVHLGRDRREMGALTTEKLSGAVQYLLGEMDKHDVEKSLIVAVEPLFPTDLYLEAAKLAPERLLVACSVVPRPADQAIEKLKSYRDRGAKALKLQPMQYDARDPAVERVIAEAVRLGLPVLFHHTDLPKSFPEALATWASNLPNGRFVVVHFGGVYGFWDVLPLARLPNVYLETSTAFARIVNSPLKAMLHFLAEENRLDKLVFGSELPSDYPSVLAAIDALLGPSAKPEVVKAVYRGNADRILKLSISARVETEEKEREGWQKISEIFGAMSVKEGSQVAEVGAGGGFFVMRLSPLVGKTGRVFAVEVSEGEVQRLRRRVREDELGNVEVIQGDVKDPKLPADSLDAVLIANAYHEMTEWADMLARIRQSLKPGGRLVIEDRVRATDAKEPSKQSRSQQVSGHGIAPELVEQELRQAGFTVAERRDPFIQRSELTHWMIVARRPS